MSWSEARWRGDQCRLMIGVDDPQLRSRFRRLEHVVEVRVDHFQPRGDLVATFGPLFQPGPELGFVLGSVLTKLIHIVL